MILINKHFQLKFKDSLLLKAEKSIFFQQENNL